MDSKESIQAEIGHINNKVGIKVKTLQIQGGKHRIFLFVTGSKIESTSRIE